MTLSRALTERVRAFVEQDVDPTDREELEALVSAGDEAELASRFSGPLAFGTAGIRGLVGAGESRMNRAVVRRVTWGVVRHLLDTVDGAAERGVVIARDGRHRSEAFQRDAAGVAAAAGVRVHWLEGTSPTPLLAHAVLEQGAACGIMITASHNPPRYNGYKVYWENGAQIVPPTDAGIAARIAEAPGARDVPCEPESSRIAPADTRHAYLASVAALSHGAATPGAPELAVAYTALHGVGQELFLKAMRQRGFDAVYPVAEQAEPDPDFPTVRFPNPEEPGALDLVLAEAERHDCALVLANDPDADRLGAAVRDRDGRYVVLNGNEIGALLGHHLLSVTSLDDPLVISTVVSSRMLQTMAAELGVRYLDTLTGFKWIANEGMRLEREEGCTFLFGYEEALGYTVGTAVRDKDGISAGVALAEQAAALHAGGETLLDQLERLRERFGRFTSRQKSVTLEGEEGAAAIAQAMERLRSAELERIGEERVASFQDLAGHERMPSNVLLYDLEGGGRVAVRPSGTEPKIKFYLEVTGEDAERRLQSLESALLERAGL